MTKDEAESLQLVVLAEVYDGEACATLLDLIDKATEKEVDRENGRWCPVCGEQVDYGTHNYCSKCGQTILWESEE